MSETVTITLFDTESVSYSRAVLTCDGDRYLVVGTDSAGAYLLILRMPPEPEPKRGTWDKWE